MEVLLWEEVEGSPYRIVTLDFWDMWGLDAVGLHQPQVPGQEEELQELGDRRTGPVHGKSQCQPQALPQPQALLQPRIQLCPCFKDQFLCSGN